KPVEKIELKKEKPELDFRLLELYELEKSQPEITKIIASEGYTSSLGTPYSKAWVSARMVTLGLRRREPREKKEEPVSFSKHEYPHAT
ncbi:hypothetical protein, partial [Staphylococcus aureus]|uniref:hypothetical protein n=1 Tax=Staphylococcus aureus TaxID=1280 RepID=UPI0038B3D7C3